jgi:adenosine deaminase
VSSPHGSLSAAELAADASQLRQWLRDLPKAELHVHLEGSVPPALALKLAARNGVLLPGAERGLAGLIEAYTFRNFDDFLRLYVAISKCFVAEIDFRDAVVGVAERFAQSGIVYAEVTFTPMTHVQRGVDAEVMLAGLEAGRVAALEQHGVDLAWVFDIVRCFPDQSDPTLELALRARDRGVVALGIGGPENDDLPTEPFVEVFARARAEGLRAVPHAGEQRGAHGVREAIELLHADRIGHGVRAIEDPRVVELLIERGIPLEVCPGSNLKLGVAESLDAHPLQRLDRAGVAFSLASDDPALFQLDLLDEYLSVGAAYGWGPQRLFEVACAALEHSFLPEERRRELRARMQECQPR